MTTIWTQLDLNQDRETMEEQQNKILFDVKCNKNDVDSLQSEMNDGANLTTASEFDCSLGVDNLSNDDKIEIKDFAAPYTHSSIKLGSLDKDTDSYTDKRIMECELPELVVCYKENTYHDIKDICIDEGVPTRDKILFETYTCLDEDKDTYRDLMKEEVDYAASIPEYLKSSAEIDFNKDSVNQSGAMDLMRVDVANNNVADKNVDDVSEEKFVPENMTSMQELNTHDSLKEFHICDGNAVDQLPVEIASEEAILASCPTLISAAEESNNSNDLEACSSISVAEETNNSSLTNNLSYDSKVESEKITFNFDPSTTEASSREETFQNGDHRHPETRILLRLEDLLSDSHRDSSREQHLSGMISYSGPVAISGSLSLRSDSSTTSTRSFAFPVLQSEWNSSPVRMAKADRRHIRKPWCWRQGLLCCRF